MSSTQVEVVSPLNDAVRPLELRAKLQAIRDSLSTGFVERASAVRLALLAALAGEHLLLLGPPGTAKSRLARRLHLAFQDATCFERLLTRFTVPEELFGPLSIKALDDDRYERLTASYLPTASIAFLDEIFKANSAILNALLTLLNEREFDNGTRRERTPLVAVIGASNELPHGEELAALYDRFLLRLHVDAVSDTNFPALLGLRDDDPPELDPDLRLTPADLKRIRDEAKEIDVPDDVVALLSDLRKWCQAEKIAVSDRRWVKIVKLLKVSALTNDRRKVSIWDCSLIQHCVWAVPSERSKVHRWYLDRVGAGEAPRRFTAVVVAWDDKLATDQQASSQARNQNGELLFRSDDTDQPTTQKQGWLRCMRGGEPLYVGDPRVPPIYPFDEEWKTERYNKGNGYTAEELDRRYGHIRDAWDVNEYTKDRRNWFYRRADLPGVMELTRHDPIHIEACVSQLDGHANEASSYQAELVRYMATMENEVRAHLWLLDDLFDDSRKVLVETVKEMEGLRKRLLDVRQGFLRLPVAETRDEGLSERKSA